MKRTITYALIFLLGILMASPPAPVSAQSHSTRTQKLREHERRIQQIITDRRAKKRQEEEEARKRAIDSGEISPREEEPAEQPQVERRQRAISNVVMGFKFSNEEGDTDYNIIVQEGETFVSEVYLFNIDQNPIDRVRLALDYDKRFITPLRVFDTSIAPFIKGDPEFDIDQRDAIIKYDASLKTSISSPEIVLLRILWRAERATPFTGIDFAFSELERPDDTHTGIYVGDLNILGVSDDPSDGVLSGGLMIQGPPEKREVLQGKAEELRGMYFGSVASDDQVGLQLIGPPETPRVGDEFVVKVRLNNPEGALIDSINFAVLFDPNVIQVLDRDEFNYIIRGVNVSDGPYHEFFPWDMHKKNEVRNDRGLVNYQKALTNGASLPSRTFAAIHFRALAPTAETAVGFVKGRVGAPNMTSVRYFGFERLDLQSPELSLPTIKFPVLPPSVAIAAEGRSEMDSPAVQADELQVRDLKIERE